MRWLRSPPVHFLAIGVALLALAHHRGILPAPTPPPTLVITAARLAQLRANLGPESPGATSTDGRALLEGLIDDEILYREALARGLDQHDRSVRWRLAEKMRFLVEGARETGPSNDDSLSRQARALELDRDDPFVRRMLVQKMRLLLERSDDEPSADDRELEAYMECHRDRYLQPARTSLWHVYLARDRRGAAVDGDARELLDRLRAQGTPPAEAVRLGDPFPPGTHLRAQSESDLTRIFGPEVAPVLLALEPGSWQGPVRSAYGLHLVWVDETTPAHLPPLAAVRSRVVAQLLQERREARFAEAMRALRARYVVRVEPAAGENG